MAHRPPRGDKAIVSRAQQLSPEQLRRLADLEWRSRQAAGPAYIAAGTELLSERSTEAEFRETRDAAARLVGPLGLDAFVETLAAQSIQQAALCALLGDRATQGTRMYLGRAWRALMKEIAETS